MNYPIYNNQLYFNDLQNMRDKIDAQIRNMQQQPIAQQPITQNFQIAPSNINGNEIEGRYAESINDVKNTFVMKTGMFINKDCTSLWIKDVSGNIKTYRLEEVIEMDEKDKEIYSLKKQIEEMRGEIENAKHDFTNVDEQIANTKPTKVQINKRSNVK